jgi:hypothetical protein
MVGVPSCGHSSRSVNLLHSGQIRLPPGLFDDELELGVFIYLPRLTNHFTPSSERSQFMIVARLNARDHTCRPAPSFGGTCLRFTKHTQE